MEFEKGKYYKVNMFLVFQHGADQTLEGITENPTSFQLLLYNENIKEGFCIIREFKDGREN